MSVWLTIPTRGDRDSLTRAIANSGLPFDHIVLVHTDPTSAHVRGCTNLQDFGPLNIQRWWNIGIEEATRRGAKAVVVANDDITIGHPDAITTLGEAAAPLSYVAPGRTGPRSLTGWCWAIRPHDTHLRPDEAYRWWYGDDDLELRARAAGITPVAAAVDITHRTSTDTSDPRLASLITDDQRRFTRQHLVL